MSGERRTTDEKRPAGEATTDGRRPWAEGRHPGRCAAHGAKKCRACGARRMAAAEAQWRAVRARIRETRMNARR